MTAGFLHRAGMITKPEVRACVLSRLALPAGGVLWDVGAGSGSVAVEAAAARPGLRVVAVERRADDAGRIRANAARHGVAVEVVEGEAPGVLDRLPRPDRVFVGGGGLDVLDACLAALAPGGVAVATFAAADRAAQAARRLGQVVQVSVARGVAGPGGGLRFEADNPVFVAWGAGRDGLAGRPEAGTATAGTAAGRVVVVGTGPGGAAHRTAAAVEAVASADVVVGYEPYVDAVADLLRPDQEVHRWPMGAEAGRAAQALALAGAGRQVALVSSGDAGLFGMASVTLELAGLDGAGGGTGPEVVVVPGVTAALAAAAQVGAPLADGFAAVSLSDVLVPWEVVERRLSALAGADLPIALYNPRSSKRPHQLRAALDLLAAGRGAATPVAAVTRATGPGQEVAIATLGSLDVEQVGMGTVVLVGTPSTLAGGGRMVAPRHHLR